MLPRRTNLEEDNDVLDLGLEGQAPEAHGREGPKQLLEDVPAPLAPLPAAPCHALRRRVPWGGVERGPSSRQDRPPSASPSQQCQGDSLLRRRLT
jgi:hypothetical protein